MNTDRRFLVARSLARLIRREHQPSGRAIHGYFSGQGDRDHFVSVETGGCYLVLAPVEDLGGDDRTEVPRAHAEALLDVCACKVGYERTRVQVGDRREVFLDHIMAPETLDLVTVQFADAEESKAFAPPAWLGPEVSDDPAYSLKSIALHGVPPLEEPPLTNAALDELLDTLERPSEPERRTRIEPTLEHEISEAAGMSSSRHRDSDETAEPETDTDHPNDPIATLRGILSHFDHSGRQHQPFDGQ